MQLKQRTPLPQLDRTREHYLPYHESIKFPSTDERDLPSAQKDVVAKRVKANKEKFDAELKKTGVFATSKIRCTAKCRECERPRQTHLLDARAEAERV